MNPENTTPGIRSHENRTPLTAPDGTTRPAQPAGACLDCPRRCRAERTPQSPGLCGVSAPAGRFRVARIMIHRFEEPYISGETGSGAVFFSGCALHCVFCQNDRISRQLAGRDLSLAELAEAIRRLAASGVANINLVTGSHYIASMPALLTALRQPDPAAEPTMPAIPAAETAVRTPAPDERAAGRLPAAMPPILWNSSAYETVDGLRTLEGLVDIYLPDLKFADAGLARQIAGAADYFEVAKKAIAEMVRQQPQAVFDEKGLLQRGTAVRHLVLPGQWRDSCQVIDALAELVPLDTPLSIMSQYVPPQQQETWPERSAVKEGGEASAAGRDRWWTLPPELARSLSRRLTTYEYEKVLDHALSRGFTRILGQDRSSAHSHYTPDFLLRDD